MAEDRLARPDDAALVRAMADGSEDALAALYDRHADGIFSLVFRLTNDRGTAEEVVQEAFLALWNRAELFDPALGSLAAWLNTIARNRAVDRLRAAGRRPRVVALSDASSDDEDGTAALERLVAAGTVLGGAAAAPGPEASVDLVVLRELLRGALGTMDETERTVILLAYQDGLTQAEIAERLGWPLGTVKTRTRRALMRLRGVLADEFGPEIGLGVVPVPAGEA